MSKQDKKPNFRDKNDNLFLVRCFECGGDYGKENYAPAVSSGQCAWCGWKENEARNQFLNEVEG